MYSTYIRAPIVKQIETLPLHIPGSLVWDNVLQSLFISTDKRWVQVGSVAQSVPQEPTYGSRATASQSIQATNVQAFKFLQMPSIRTITDFPLQEPGGIVLAADTRKCWFSSSLGWTEFSQLTTINSAGTGVSLISSFTPSTYNLRSLVAGPGVTLSTNLAGTEITISSTGGGGGVASVTTGLGISNTGTPSNVNLINTGVLTLSANTGITNTGSAQNPVLISTASLSSEPAGLGSYSVVSANNVNPTSFVLKTLTQGSNLTITPNLANTDLTFSVSGVVTSISNGVGISITGTPTSPIISNTGVLSFTASTGLVNNGTATNPIVANNGVLSLTAGTGINNSGTASNPIINNTGVIAIAVTPGLSNTGTASNPILNNTTVFSSELAAGSSYSVVSSNTSNPTALITKTITAGTNISITSTGTDLTINSAPSTGVTGFSAMKSGVQTFTFVGPNPVGGVITQWTTSGAFNFDTSLGAFNPTNGVYTVPSNGIYSINACVSIVPNTNQDSYYLIVRVNGVTDAYRTDDQPSSNVSLTTTLRLNTNAFFSSGDSVEIVVLDSVAVIGSSFTVSSSPDTWFTILKL